MTDLIRCQWTGSDPRYVAYHDEEWGVPVHDDRLHFAIQARALLETPISTRWTLFGGGGASLPFSEYSKDATSDLDPLVVAGVILR